MSLNFVALGLYAVAAIGGLIMALRAFKGQGSPIMMAILHLGFAGAGSLTLAAFIFGGAVATGYTVALACYVLAALGGLYLGSFRFREGFPGTTLIYGHAGLAVVGTLTLVATSLS